MIAEYVIKNIDAALENGWIKVFYQPVIRTLTGQLCGAESLARWIDPQLGFLSPDKFIGALEASRQIHKLDCWIVDKVCSDISERLKRGLDAVPVSVNFSRLDFEATDMLNVLEKAVEKYDIPKDYLHIEITESMIVSDADLMSRMIDNFRNAGYEVWMDDFGSGYSSLTLLKDYYFDTLKMDMDFLNSFTDRSKSIITSAITMAKDLSIMTLAEGVETEEQVDFLRSIGCGKLQGYFFGKPMSIDEFFEHISESGITIEPRKWRHYYQVASFAARNTDEPLEIIEDDENNFRTLYMNDEYKRQIQMDASLSSDELDQLIYETKSPLLKKYREFANKVETSKNLETFYYTYNGNILCLQAIELAELEGKHIIKASNRNISMDSNLKKQTSVDSKLKELNHMFESVVVINPEKNTISPLIGKFAYADSNDNNSNNLAELLDTMSKQFIAPSDREKFNTFLDPKTLKERIDNSGKGFIESIFKLKQPNGDYKWKEVSIMLVPGTGGKEYLINIKPTADNAEKYLSSNNEIFNHADYGISSNDSDIYSKIWENILSNASVKFFWKDKNRKFLGANSAFLDFFGIKIDDILGKNDDEMEWHIDDNSYRNDELNVLKKGAHIKNSPGQCIVNGVVHNIMANKSPIYINGQIVGLMGYFVDVDQEMERLDALFKTRKLDKVTGLMNISSLSEATMEYAHHYATNKEDYALMIVRNENHHRIISDFGDDFANKLLKHEGEMIVEVTGGTCAVGKCLASDFGIVTTVHDRSEIEDLKAKLEERLSQIKELDGNRITLKIRIAYKLRSDDGITDENMYSAVLEEFM